MKLIPKTILRAIKEITSPASKITKHITGKNNIIAIDQGVYLEKITFDIIGNGNTIQIESGCHLKNVTFTMRGNDCNFILHKNVVFDKGGSILSFGHNAYFEMGESSTVVQAWFAILEDNSKIILGKDCMLSKVVDVRTSDSHPIFDKTSGKRINFAQDVVIKDHVWIGDSCKILKGVIIENDSIVGCGSIVTRQFEESNVIIAGIPARVVKRNITWRKDSCPPIEIITGVFITKE